MQIAKKIVKITQEPTELFKILKFEDLVSSGGEAKRVIEEGLVSVNGFPETRKRCKILSGDIIQFKNTTLKIEKDDNNPARRNR